MIDVLTMDSGTLKKVYAAGEASEPPPPRFTLAMAQVLKKIIVRRRDDYYTTIAEDATLLQDSAVQGRRRMAIEIRLGEKEILASALGAVEEKIHSLNLEESLREAPNGHAEGARKKRRKM